MTNSQSGEPPPVKLGRLSTGTKGYTLIELIIYIALIPITGAAFFFIYLVSSALLKYINS